MEPATGTQPEEPGPSPALPDPPGTVYQVTWVTADAPAVVDVPDTAAPLADVVEGEAIWRLYVVQGESAEPRLLRESERWLQRVVWQPDGDTVTLTYFTSAEGLGYVRGYMKLDVTSTSTMWDFRRDAQPSLYPDPQMARFLVDDRSGPRSGPFQPAVYSVTEPDGQTLRLQGFDGEAQEGWSPDGRYFVATGYPGPNLTPQEQARDLYLLEPGRDTIVLLGRAPQGFSLQVGWSPDSARLAFTQGTDLIIFDVESHDRTSLSLGVEVGGFPTWTEDGRYISIGDGVVDVASRSVVLEPTGESTVAAEVAPGGSHLVRTTDIFSRCQSPSIQQGNLTLLTDLASGRETTLFDCEDGVHTQLRWLGEERLIAFSPDCYGCEPRRFWIKLVTIPVTVRDLTEGRENGASFAVSPDGSRILVGGDKLRVYSSTGELLREIVPPPGTAVTGLAWSRDGFNFTYVVGPARINLI
jgi:hypothetical protein